MTEEWNEDAFYRDRYFMENQFLKQRVEELEKANTSMMSLIQMNDQKQALMEASPEFAEAIKKIEQETIPSS